MRKILSVILFLALLCAISVTAFAIDTKATPSVPTPTEIEDCYQNIKSTPSLTQTYIPSALELKDNIGDNPLLMLGVVSAYAEENKDASVLSAIAEEVYEDILPVLSEDDYVSILSSEGYTDMFKFSIMDIYSCSAKTRLSQTQSEISSSKVDEVLKEYISPDDPLVVDALASIQNKSIISAEELEELVKDGDISAKQMALKTMCSVYPNDAYASVKDILSNESTDSMLFNSAIHFLPRLVNATDNLTETEAIEIIDGILRDTSDDFTQISCVQALAELDSIDAANVLSAHISFIPTSLVDYYNERSQFKVVATQASSIQPASTSNRLGHAIYRDGVALDQWHTGIVAHISGPEYHAGNNDDDNKWVAHARGTGKTTGFDTFDTFMRNSSGVSQGYVGERYMSSMTNSDHYNIFYTAVDLANEAIPYTFVNMISIGLFAPTNYDISDIEKIRCDGFVEYAYESNGIKLQGDYSNWDISTASGAVNHNALELTPKSQYDAFNRTNPR